MSYSEIEQLKYIGFFLMLIDHVTLLYYPDFIVGRIIGRLCAPLFFYLFSIGFNNTKDLKKYLSRLLSWAVVSQIIIWTLIDFEKMPNLNILFTLSWCLIALYSITKQASKFRQITVLIIFALLATFFHFDYGWYAVLSVFLFYYHEDTFQWLFLWILINSLAFFLLDSIQIFAVLATVIIFDIKKFEFNLPRVNWYFMYCFQWLVLPIFSFLKVLV